MTPVKGVCHENIIRHQCRRHPGTAMKMKLTTAVAVAILLLLGCAGTGRQAVHQPAGRDTDAYLAVLDRVTETYGCATRARDASG